MPLKILLLLEGGAICIKLPKPFNNSDTYKHLRMMTLNGQTKDAFHKDQSRGMAVRYCDAGLKNKTCLMFARLSDWLKSRQYDKLLTERKRVFFKVFQIIS